MDLNIGAALWFGARGIGVLRTRAPEQTSSHLCRYADEQVRVRVRARARARARG